MTEIVVSPTITWLRENLRTCKSRFLVASPFVTSSFCELAESIPPTARSLLLTRTDLRDFALGVSDLQVLCALARSGTSVMSLRGLHAKVYVIDGSKALVTSANATEGGMRRNLECGLAISDRVAVAEVARTVLTGFGSCEPPALWTADELTALQQPTAVIRNLLPTVPRSQVARPSEMRVPVIGQEERRSLVGSFSGWTALALEGVLDQDSDEFSVDDLLVACGPAAARRYPDNRHVREQLRKQLQRLRDLGIVDFLGGGTYRRMAGPRDIDA